MSFLRLFFSFHALVIGAVWAVMMKVCPAERFLCRGRLVARGLGLRRCCVDDPQEDRVAFYLTRIKAAYRAAKPGGAGGLGAPSGIGIDYSRRMIVGHIKAGGKCATPMRALLGRLATYSCRSHFFVSVTTGIAAFH
jgi:hypothetical protein